MSQTVILTVTNTGLVPSKIRALDKNSANLQVEPEYQMSKNLGATYSKESQGGYVMEFLKLGPGHAAQFRISFLPLEVKEYQLWAEFLVDERELVRVIVLPIVYFLSLTFPPFSFWCL